MTDIVETPVTQDLDEAELIATEAKSFGRQTWDRFKRHKLAVGSLFFLILLTASFWVVPALSGYEYDQVAAGIPREGPSAEHWFGTDDIGRDLMVRTFTGGQYSIRIAALTAVTATLIGTILGAVAGYVGKWVDAVISWVTNMVLVIPILVILLVLSLRFGSGPWSIALIIAFLSWPRLTRVVRGLFLSYKQLDFVQAARAAGAGPGRIMFRHILPNTFGPIVVEMTLGVGVAIIIESTLSFLSLGVPPPTPTLGNLLNEAKGNIDSRFYALFFPGMMVMAITLCVNFLGDGMRDALDPTSRRSRT
jgi:ABC-type dipeptide/oligopeptide/nickel transport system permease subunit